MTSSPGPARAGSGPTVTLRGLAAAIAPALGIEAEPTRLALAEAEVVADRHGVVGLLPVDAAPGPLAAGEAGVVERVRRFRHETRARLTRAVADLRAVRRAAACAGAPLVAVKGVVLAADLYPRPDTRPFADVDVLTSPAAFGDLVAALEAAGGSVRTRNWNAMIRLRSAEVTVVMPAGTAVDVHWSLANVARLRAEYRLDTAALLAGATPGPVEGVDTLDPVAHLGYVCWHQTVSGGVRLLWSCDVELAARRLVDRGADLAEWARDTRTLLPVALALDHAAILFPGGGAATLAEALPGSPWRWANARLRRQVVSSPVGRWSGAFLPLATRTTTLRSVAAVRPPLAALAGRLAPDPDVLDIMPLDDGGAAGRAAYLAAVQSSSL